nr:F0F1 ATP synthase subunit gamma [Thiorhodovibrio winogradskyi]
MRRQINSAGDLQSVVRTMKSLAASSIHQYEQSVDALVDYARTVELGLGVCFRGIGKAGGPTDPSGQTASGPIGAVIFGSDQGLVGQFNDQVADHAVQKLAGLTVLQPDVQLDASPDAQAKAQPDATFDARPDAKKDQSPSQPQVWAVGERVQARLADAGLAVVGQFAVPSSVEAITTLVGEILVEIEAHQRQGEFGALYLFYNRPSSGAVYAPVDQRLLPLDAPWRHALADAPWPTNNLPEVIGGDSDSNTGTLRALIREYLFVSIFRACAESLASENASRLAAMQRADKNIDELLDTLNASFHRLRQSGIDEELFDVIAGFEALSEPRRSAQSS